MTASHFALEVPGRETGCGVEENENLTEDDFVRAIQLFQRRPEAVEAYVTIKNQKLRSSYLNKELKGFVI